jgi:hypothetical protein
LTDGSEFLNIKFEKVVNDVLIISNSILQNDQRKENKNMPGQKINVESKEVIKVPIRAMSEITNTKSKKSKTGKGTLLGMLVGASTGALIGVTTYTESKGFGPEFGSGEEVMWR